MQKFHGNISVGLISSKIMLEGPIKKEKSSFLFTARRTYIDALFRPFSKSIADNAVTGFYFYDINAKYNYKISNKNRLFISFYTGKDKYFVKMEESDNESINQAHQDLKWGNITGAIRWLSIISSKVSLNNTVYFTKFDYNSSNYSLEEQIHDDEKLKKEYSYSTGSGIEEIGTKTKFDWFLNNHNNLKLGIDFSQKRFLPSFSSEYYNDEYSDLNIEKSSAKNVVEAVELSTYIENNIKFKKISANLGINFNGFYVNQKLYKYIEPRINTNFKITDNFNIQASYSNAHQYLHLLSNSSVGMPTDLWVPTTEKTQPITANIYDIGFNLKTNKKYNFAISGFYKTLNNLIMYKQGTVFLDIKTDWQNKITKGEGVSYGIECLVQKNKGVITGQISYTYSRSFRNFKEINNGNTFPYKYDRPHNLNIQAEYHINKNILFTTNWILMSGQNTTFSSQYQILSDYESFIGYGNYYYGYNNARFPLYHRLDVAFNFTKKKTKKTRIWTVGIYNVYNRLNPYYIESSQFQDKITGVSFAPIMPFVSYSLKF